MGSKAGSQPLVSILIPAWNVVDKLKACLDSVFALGDDLPYDVTVLVDCINHSDPTIDLALEYLDSHPNLTVYLTYSNGNLQLNMDKLSKLGKGEYSFLLDADDKIDIIAFKEALSRLSKLDPKPDILTFPFLMQPIDGDGTVTDWEAKDLDDFRRKLIGENFRAHYTWDKWYKTSIVKGIFDLDLPVSIGSDTCFNVKAVLKNPSVVHFDLPVVIHVKWPDAMTAAKERSLKDLYGRLFMMEYAYTLFLETNGGGVSIETFGKRYWGLVLPTIAYVLLNKPFFVFARYIGDMKKTRSYGAVKNTDRRNWTWKKRLLALLLRF